MKIRWQITVYTIVAFLILLALFGFPASKGDGVKAQQESIEIPPEGGGRFESEPADLISDEQHREIQAQLAASVAKLTRQGRLAPASPDLVQLSWPIRKAASQTDYSIEGISNYVDENPAFPNQLLDWNCGARTYDQPSGYNHGGIDIFTWPFAWKKVDDNGVEIIAAAPGTIIQKNDGNFDRNCAFNNGTPNAVYIRHSDGSVAWYLHMKSGSPTTKQVGDTVAAGEKLGIVGSSGSSTGPHLHFEIYNANNQLQDPFQGACNTLNSFSYWSSQESYRVSRINNLMTESAPPVFPSCPTTETTNEKTVFQPGDTIYTSIYYRDQLPNQTAQYSLLRSDGSTFQTWSQSLTSSYDASYWYYSWILPSNAPNGVWTFRAVYNSVIYDRPFTVGPAIPFATVSGKVLTSDNRGLRNASVSLTDPNGQRRTVLTNSFGRFTFDQVATGQTYTIAVSSKRFRYSSQSLQILDNLVIPDFIGQE